MLAEVDVSGIDRLTSTSVDKKSIVAIIPARYGSTRLTGKPLLDLAGKTLIQRVYEQVLKSHLVSSVIVATDDSRIGAAVEAFGGHWQMTLASHRTGTDRIAEVARNLRSELIVNVQGDEPFISPQTIDAAIEPLLEDPMLQMSTTCELLQPDQLLDPHVVKVVTDDQGYALYFSRAPIPFPRDAYLKAGMQGLQQQVGALIGSFKRHAGLYVYRRDFLLCYASWPCSPLEEIEQLEQLRALERGVKIKVVQVEQSSFGIDTPQDLERALKLLENR
ncbi:MAG: 3-deoxy-manno-octulosonate cytidylyltransferase [Acidobacteriota bacterium]|nr:3-deoxy-manno-octulosonate cytidylyltransferase [Blastocatellia bacterium]MDW8413533.1 3-deoxy-manno-octulosonate cytidylyltransferase [Acidobacteriota bacterium]